MDTLSSLLCVLSIASRASANSHFQLDRAASARAQAGKEQLDRIVGEGEAATRSCWSAAVEEPKAGCRAAPAAASWRSNSPTVTLKNRGSISTRARAR